MGSIVSPTNSPWPGQTHLEFSINTPSEAVTSSPPTHSQSHSEHRTPLFIASSSSPLMIVTETLLSLILPDSLRPRTEVLRNTPVSPSLARHALHYISDDLVVQWLGLPTCRPLACRGR